MTDGSTMPENVKEAMEQYLQAEQQYKVDLEKQKAEEYKQKKALKEKEKQKKKEEAEKKSKMTESQKLYLEKSAEATKKMKEKIVENYYNHTTKCFSLVEESDEDVEEVESEKEKNATGWK